MTKRFLLACSLLPVFSAQALDFDANEMVAAHNRWRKTVGTPPLIYSTKLAASAQEWANHLKQSNHCHMRHSKPDGKYGENLFWASAIEWSDGKREVQKLSPDKVVDDWGSERADYDYKNNSCASGKICGHYTQLVWKTTTSVGCAAAVCEDSRDQVWVCQYQPPGNWVGKKPY
ncbi:MAG: SCP-like extracellular [Gammaproteobacteria bacterium]|nr:SCP-like extracellular [Gammaproteobacteria bacterium]MBU1481795.1 SCP-like extracellular [Gammaproteobacteria bacterium]